MPMTGHSYMPSLRTLSRISGNIGPVVPVPLSVAALLIISCTCTHRSAEGMQSEAKQSNPIHLAVPMFISTTPCRRFSIVNACSSDLADIAGDSSQISSVDFCMAQGCTVRSVRIHVVLACMNIEMHKEPWSWPLVRSTQATCTLHLNICSESSLTFCSRNAVIPCWSSALNGAGRVTSLRQTVSNTKGRWLWSACFCCTHPQPQHRDD